MMSLDKQTKGFQGPIERIVGDPVIVERLHELGFVEGEKVRIHSKLGLGEPIIVEVQTAKLALRNEEAKCIQIKG